MADDTANCPAPPRGSAWRSRGSDRKPGGATGCTQSAGNAPERPITAPNFQPDTQTHTCHIDHNTQTQARALCASREHASLRCKSRSQSASPLKAGRRFIATRQIGIGILFIYKTQLRGSADNLAQAAASGLIIDTTHMGTSVPRIDLHQVPAGLL